MYHIDTDALLHVLEHIFVSLSCAKLTDPAEMPIGGQTK